MPLLALLLALLWPTAALAHAGDANEAGWTFTPILVVPLLLSGGLWAIGFSRRWRRSDLGRPALKREAAYFVSGWLVLTLAIVSPLHEAGERSFTAHMLEHEILMMLAAPLLALAHPLPTMLWGAAQPWRAWIGALTAATLGFWRWLASPVVATLLQAAALWLWHAPALFNLALIYDGWHITQHLSFIFTALIFWGAMLDKRRDIGSRALCLFLTSIVSGVLGAMMSFSESPWYAPYAALGLTPQGLTPAQDQQLAGLLMWVPGGFVHAAAALLLIAPMLRSEARSDAG